MVRAISKSSKGVAEVLKIRANEVVNLCRCRRQRGTDGKRLDHMTTQSRLLSEFHRVRLVVLVPEIVHAACGGAN